MITIALLPDTHDIPLHAIAQWRSELSAADQGRTTLMAGTPRQTEFVVARKLLKSLAQKRLDISAEVVSAAGAAPRLLTLDGGSIACSIAHSKNTILVAINTVGSIGVDVEHHQPRSIAKLVQRYFWPEGKSYFANCTEAASRAWFYRQWCIREALVKHQGDGNLFQLLGKPLTLPLGTLGQISQSHTITMGVISSGASQPELLCSTLNRDLQWQFAPLNTEMGLSALTPLTNQ